MGSIKKAVRELLDNYLDANGYRKTPERYAILDKIYSGQGHFSIESLYNRMSETKFRVSKATVYNTMELLLACGLVVRHRFKDNEAEYERAYEMKEHEHMICTECGRIYEFTDDRVRGMMRDLEMQQGFTVDNSLFYVYGICKGCKLKKRE